MDSTIMIITLCTLLFLPFVSFLATLVKVSGFGSSSIGQLFMKIFDYDPANPPLLNPFPYISAFIQSVMGSLPDLLIIGVGILALLLQNFPLLILLLTMLEILLIRFGLGMAIGYTNPGLSYGTEKLRTGIRTPIMETLFAKLGNANEIIFPNGTLFITGATLIYCVMALFYNYDVFSELDSAGNGGDWSVRPWIGLSIVATGLISYSAYRMIKGNESWGSLAITILLAVLTGTLLVYQNTNIFGAEAVNFLGVPYLDSLLSSGGPITVCAPTASS